jgi:hypothetical protein
LPNSWAGEEIDMNLVILGAITKAAFAVLSLIVVLLVAQSEIARRRPRHRLLRQTILTPSEILGLRRINTHWLSNSPSRAPPGVTSIRQRGTPGSFSRD